MKQLALLSAAAASLFAAGAADAATYVANRSVGAGTVNLSITTDDTIGVLDDANIVDFLITVDDGTTSFTLSGFNADFDIIGTGLSATATDLLFDFDQGAYALFQSPLLASGGPFYCLQGGATACFDFLGAAEGFDPVVATQGQIERTPFSGVQVIASVGAIPEPATWGLMILGLGAVGGAVRRQVRRSNVRFDAKIRRIADGAAA